jgi:hypothetical protein
MRAWLSPILLAAVAGCAPVSRVEPVSEHPEGYVAIERGSFEWRILSAEGVVAGLRTFPREPAGTLDFWATVVRREIETTKSYVLEAAEPLSSADGVAGRFMRFAPPSPTDALYLVALFVKDQRIVVFEAGGPREAVEKDLELLKKHAASLRIS